MTSLHACLKSFCMFAWAIRISCHGEFMSQLTRPDTLCLRLRVCAYIINSELSVS